MQTTVNRVRTVENAYFFSSCNVSSYFRCNLSVLISWSFCSTDNFFSAKSLRICISDSSLCFILAANFNCLISASRFSKLAVSVFVSSNCFLMNWARSTMGAIGRLMVDCSDMISYSLSSRYWASCDISVFVALRHVFRFWFGPRSSCSYTFSNDADSSSSSRALVIEVSVSVKEQRLHYAADNNAISVLTTNQSNSLQHQFRRNADGSHGLTNLFICLLEIR